MRPTAQTVSELQERVGSAPRPILLRLVAVLRRLIAISPSVDRGLRRAWDWLPRGKSLPEDVWRRRHHTLSWLLRAHVAIVFVFALARGYTVGQALMYGMIIAVFAGLSATDPCRRQFVSAMNALGLVTSSAVLVDLSGGVIEMHFHFFVMIAILTLYQDWLPFLLAIGFVVLHHGLLGVLDPRAVYNDQEDIKHPIEWAFIHGFFILAASVASIVAWKLNEEQAYHDALTRLPNRRLFQDRVSHALTRTERHPARLAVLFIDLDGFKDVNDSLGHGAGDQLLCKVAERFTACLRSSDTAARLGGDEFAILLEDLNGPDDAAALAERLIDALSAPFLVADHDTRVGASIGIALNEPNDTTESLLRNADVAMYSVKAAGRARFDFYAADMLTSVVDRVQLGQELRVALEQREFVVYYQPMVEMATGAIRGLEALVRWDHPQRGVLVPADFLDVAEETGVITAIGQFVLETACTQMASWNLRLRDKPLRVSVNLSPTQVLHPGMVDAVAATLATTGLDPEMLVLELTEAVMIQDKDAAARQLQQLKELGVHLAIDDFGTGYSSLAYLRQLPFDILKIDKGFIDGVTHGSTESALTRAILTLAETLHMTGVAEGVEEAAQASRLQELGCRFAQGYLFSRPVPAQQIEELLAMGHRTAELAGGNQP